MFGFSIGEWVLLMVIALIAIGPKQLPEVARTIGRLMGELRRATSDFTRAFTDVRDDTRNTWQDARKDFTNPFTASAQNYSQTVRAAPEGTVSSGATAPATDEASASAPKYPITPDDPFGSGHNSQAHQAPPGFEEQGSLFIPTSDSSSDPTLEKEEQLAFHIKDEHGDGHNDEGEGHS